MGTKCTDKCKVLGAEPSPVESAHWTPLTIVMVSLLGLRFLISKISGLSSDRKASAGARKASDSNCSSSSCHSSGWEHPQDADPTPLPSPGLYLCLPLLPLLNNVISPYALTLCPKINLRQFEDNHYTLISKRSHNKTPDPYQPYSCHQTLPLPWNNIIWMSTGASSMPPPEQGLEAIKPGDLPICNGTQPAVGNVDKAPSLRKQVV